MERDIENYMRQEVVKMGGLFYKFTSPGNRGVPDRIVILPDGRVVFVELKTKEGRLSELQKYQIKQLEKRNVMVFVVKGMDEVRRWLGEIRATQLSDQGD